MFLVLSRRNVCILVALVIIYVIRTCSLNALIDEFMTIVSIDRSSVNDICAIELQRRAMHIESISDGHYCVNDLLACIFNVCLTNPH